MKQYLILILMIFGVTNSLVAKDCPINKENETLYDDIFKSKWLEDEGLCEVHAIGDARGFYYIGEWNGEANGFGTGVFFKTQSKKEEFDELYRGQWKNGASHGFGGKQYSLGNGETIFYFGEFKNGKMDGQGYCRVNSKKGSYNLFGTFKDDQPWKVHSISEKGATTYITTCNGDKCDAQKTGDLGTVYSTEAISNRVNQLLTAYFEQKKQEDQNTQDGQLVESELITYEIGEIDEIN